MKDTGLNEQRKARYDEYVQNALTGPGINKQSSFLLGAVRPEVVNGLMERGIKVSENPKHAIADNDIRHIRNSHGILKEGEYGVTTGDIQAIPYIVNNADEVYYMPHDGKHGVLYVVYGVDATYYVESIQDENVFTGKQIIKVPAGIIPGAYKKIVGNKEAFIASLNGNTAAWQQFPPQVYVQDVLQPNASNGKVTHPGTDVKRFSFKDVEEIDERSLMKEISSVQTELYKLRDQKKRIQDSDETYTAAREQLKNAGTHDERIAAAKALHSAREKLDAATAEIDLRTAELNERLTELRDEENRRHQEAREKYANVKTAGYATEPDTRMKDLDDRYMEAVKSGNKAEVRKLVRQAAEAAMPKSVVRDAEGDLLVTYHWTTENFTVFDRKRARTGNEMDGFFFAPDKESTREYGDRRIAAYLNITNPAINPTLISRFEDSGTILREKLAAQGYDGVIRTENGEIYEYMVFDPEQISLADPVTYDDDGNVIPLSERFNKQNNDIRFSFKDDPDTEYAELAKEHEKHRGILERMVESLPGRAKNLKLTPTLCRRKETRQSAKLGILALPLSEKGNSREGGGTPLSLEF